MRECLARAIAAPVPSAANSVVSLLTKRAACYHHTAGSDTIFVQIYMDLPPGAPGVSKNQIFFFTNENVFLLR